MSQEKHTCLLVPMLLRSLFVLGLGSALHICGSLPYPRAHHGLLIVIRGLCRGAQVARQEQAKPIRD